MTSPPCEEGPTEVVPAVAVQSASSEPPQPCHELPCPTPLELNKSHLRPLCPLGKENNGEPLEDKVCQSQVSGSVLFKSKLECGSNRGSDKTIPPFVSCLEEGPVIVELPSASGLPGESGDLEATPQVELQQEMPSVPAD